MKLEITLHFHKETSNKVRYSSDSNEGVSDVYVDKSVLRQQRGKADWPDQITITVEG